MGDNITEVLFMAVSVMLFCFGVVNMNQQSAYERDMVSALASSMEIHETCMLSQGEPEFDLIP